MTEGIQTLPGHPRGFAITEAEQVAVARLAGVAVRAAATGLPAPPDDLGDLGRRIVSGVFVSLHQGRRLRGCIGYLGQPMALGSTLLRAARQATVGDRRFTPMSEADLAGLSIEAWLLHSWERLPVDSAARRAAVTIGVHGLDLTLGRERGVFLPSVPVEQGWDVDAYLAELGGKAGLAADTWRDPRAVLDRFQGVVVMVEI
jgi:AmmeMemoRadiSam system protein A